MKVTGNFYTSPKSVLEGCLSAVPAAVAVVAIDDHGGVSVYASHSTPLTMLMLKQGIPEILRLSESQQVQG